MLEIIRKFLIEYGFLDSSEQLDFNFENQESLIFYIQNSKSDKILLKVVFNGAGKKEFESQSYAYQTFPFFVPEPLFYREHERIEFLFFECIFFQNFREKLIFSQKSIWFNDLPEFLFKKNYILKDDNKFMDNDYVALIDAYKHYLPQNIYTDIQILLDTPLIGKFKLLPIKPQHGDFTINNLGVRNGKMVVFDWENFGFFYTFGLDFTTFISSALNHDPNQIVQFLKGKSSKQTEFLRISLIKNSFLNKIELELLFKICYTLFYIMKKKLGYGEEIINKVDRTLTYILNN